MKIKQRRLHTIESQINFNVHINVAPSASKSYSDHVLPRKYCFRDEAVDVSMYEDVRFLVQYNETVAAERVISSPWTVR